MKSNIIIFHGTGGHPEENWFPWLKKELAQHQIEVVIPQFPTPEGQSLAAWNEIFKKYEDLISEKTIFIGHSLGGLFLLRVLEQLNKKVSAAFFVASTVGVKPIKFYDADEKFSPGFEFDWESIKKSAGHFSVYHSDNDPYVSLGNGELLAQKLGTKLNCIRNRGHFNASAGCTEFPELLSELTSLFGNVILV